MQWYKKLFAFGAMLASHVCGYNVQDLHTLNLQIVKSTGQLLSFDLALNADNQFSATIQNLDAGLTNITLNGYDQDGTKMYNGDWEGDVRQDGKPTQVELFMVDLKPDIASVADLGNIAPFFLSIEMEPSKPNAYIGLAGVFVDTCEYVQAAEAVLKAVEVCPAAAGMEGSWCAPAYLVTYFILSPRQALAT